MKMLTSLMICSIVMTLYEVFSIYMVSNLIDEVSTTYKSQPWHRTVHTIVKFIVVEWIGFAIAAVAMSFFII